MLSGIKLTLLIGPGVPIPVPQVVLDALTSVRVVTGERAENQSAFELTFTLSNRSPLHTIFLVSGGTSIPPLIRVIVIVTMNGLPEVLIDGIMRKHEITPGSDPGHSKLTIFGDDLTAAMGYLDFSGFPFPAIPAEARIALILAKYAFFGIIPLIIPSALTDVPIPIQKIPRQKGTDLDYITVLANMVGHVFYIEPGPLPGTNVAYWGPEIKIGIPQPALNTNMDAHTNVESMNFSIDNEARIMPIIWIQDELPFPIPIPVPDVSILNPPLGLIPPIPKKFPPLNDAAKRPPLQAALFGLAKSAQSADAISVTGSLNVLRYGRILKARRLVGVRGAGPAFDGLYYVTSVTHNIKRGEYKQDFTAKRNGLLSTVPRVPP